MKNDGGPAFPVVALEPPYYIKEGMTLRDWFAGQALETIISLCQNRDGYWSTTAVACNAYEVADAMIAEREK